MDVLVSLVVEFSPIKGTVSSIKFVHPLKAFASIDVTVSDIEICVTLEHSAKALADKTVSYDGEKHSIYVENLPDGVSVKYSNNEKT